MGAVIEVLDVLSFDISTVRGWYGRQHSLS